jgi:hypothetical protein
MLGALRPTKLTSAISGIYLVMTPHFSLLNLLTITHRYTTGLSIQFSRNVLQILQRVTHAPVNLPIRTELSCCC